MNRREITDEITKSMGMVPEWLDNLPDGQLEHIWGMQSWFMTDTVLSARDKAMVAFGAATANHCPY
jgi:hypothetical protein